MTCHRCNSAVAATDRYCWACGSKLKPTDQNRSVPTAQPESLVPTDKYICTCSKCQWRMRFTDVCCRHCGQYLGVDQQNARKLYQEQYLKSHPLPEGAKPEAIYGEPGTELWDITMLSTANLPGLHKYNQVAHGNFMRIAYICLVGQSVLLVLDLLANNHWHNSAENWPQRAFARYITFTIIGNIIVVILKLASNRKKPSNN